MKSNRGNSLDSVFMPYAGIMLAAGVGMWVVGYGLLPLAVAGGSLYLLRRVYKRIESGSGPLG